MKTAIIFLLIGISLPTFLMAQVRVSNQVAGSGQATISQVENQNIPGGDYKTIILKQNETCQACIDACLNDPNCKAYTYVKPGVQNVNAVCWLKSSVSNPVADQNCISGIKTVSQSQLILANPAKEMIQMQVAVAGAASNENPIDASAFIVKPIEVLKNEMSSVSPNSALVQGTAPTTAANSGNQAYRTGNGVVLNSLNTFDLMTTSQLELENVKYSTDVLKYIKNGVAQAILQHPYHNGPNVVAYFHDLPTTPHTFLLVMDISRNNNIAKVRIGTWNKVYEFDKSTFVINPESLTNVKLLFSAAARYVPNADPKSSFLNVEVFYEPSASFLWFYNIQLLQMD